jgi:hypothetical protein
MIVLRAVNLHWIDGAADDPADLCAHSSVELRVDANSLVQPDDGDWTVSAAALYLLRTLSQSHTKAHPVAEQLFPCCGHAIYEVEGDDDVLIIGCDRGIDFEIGHSEDMVVLAAKDGRRYEVTAHEWRKSVCEFADAVYHFYENSSPKVFEDERDSGAFKRFWMEWSRRRSESCPSA